MVSCTRGVRTIRVKINQNGCTILHTSNSISVLFPPLYEYDLYPVKLFTQSPPPSLQACETQKQITLTLTQAPTLIHNFNSQTKSYK